MIRLRVNNYGIFSKVSQEFKGADIESVIICFIKLKSSNFEKILNTARLASDVLNVPTVIMARTDANAAKLLTSDIDERDKPFLTGERTSEGIIRKTGGLDCAIARGIAYAKYADLIWCETDKPDIDEV